MRKKISKLRNRFWLYFVIYAFLIIILIWLFQVLTYEMVFKYEKQKDLNTIGNQTSELIDNTTNLQNKVVNYLNGLLDQELSAYICSKDQNNMISFYYPSNIDVLSEYDVSYSIYDNIISNIIGNNNYVVSEINYSSDSFLYYGKAITYKGSECYLIIIYEPISLSDVINVLRDQLLIAGLIVFILSFFIAFVISKKIAKPIDDISKVAQKWAEGDNKVTFVGSGYNELEDLSKTLNYAKDEISKASALERDLLANVTHDLKTPLTLIKSYAEMIHDISGENKEKREKHCEIIVSEVDRLTFLINDILNLSKLQSNVEEMNLTTFNLSELVETVVYKFNMALNNSGYKIVSTIQPYIFIKADEKKIEAVIYNLIGNSINYTGDDKIVKVYLIAKDNKATFEVLDSGKGIDEESVKTIWNKYKRISESHQREVKGTGLGLSIVKAVLDAHKLKYGVISKVGLGSNFYVIFNEEVEEIK